MYNIGNQGKIMRKLLGKPTTDSVHDPTVTSATIAKSPLSNNYRPISSLDAVYDTGGIPISSFDQSPDGSSAVLAGHHILKIVYFDGLEVKDKLDLRALINAQPNLRNNGPASVSDQLMVQDVKWGQNTGGKHVIWTACTSGKIFQYDLVRATSTSLGSPLDYIQMREDSRQVNSLDINPHKPSFLLSGSQDGIIRCFDIRAPIQTRTGSMFRAVSAFKCHADGVRKVQWSPKDAFTFACGTEQGLILKWDMRKPTAPMLRINAHAKACTSIAWHQDGVHFVSAGLDGKCTIWDMSKQDKRQKPKWTISTPAPVGSLAWRPGQWSVTAKGKRASQLAVTYDEGSQKRSGINAVHIWDLARPTMPYKEIQRFDTAPSSILWHDQYLLWTAGQDGLFNQCDVSFAPKVIDRQAVSTMTFSALGEVALCLDERPRTSRPRARIAHHDTNPTPSYSSSPTTPTAAPKYSVSRSDSEDDAVGSFVGPKRRGSNRKRRPSMRSASTLSTTPPANTAMQETLSLEETIKATGPFKPQQSFAIGRVPYGAKPEIDLYLSLNYLEPLHSELPYTPGVMPLPSRIAHILEHYAKAAEHVRFFRLAQTWRILAFAVDLLLHRRAQYHLEKRLDKLYATSTMRRRMDDQTRSLHNIFDTPLEYSLDGQVTPRKPASIASFDRALHPPRSLLSEELESTSNVPTPLARPVPDSGAARLDDSGRKKLTPILEPESFTLPPAAHPPHSLEMRKRLDSVPLSVNSHDSEATHASTEGYDFYDTEAISKAIDVPNARPKPTQVIDFREPGSPHRPKKPPVFRHDSDDSFTRVFSVSVSEDSRQTSVLTDSSNGAKAAIQAAIRQGSGSDENDFASRIRGKHIENSPPTRPVATPFRKLLHRTETDLSMMTSYTEFTDEHHAITQTTTDSFESPYPSQHVEFSTELPQYQEHLAMEADMSPEDDISPYIVETDYLYWPGDDPWPHPIRDSTQFTKTGAPPLQPYTLISRALQFEVKKSALNAMAMILLLKPLLPDDIIDSFQAAAILRQQHQRLMNLKSFVEAALLRKMCIKGWPGGPLSSWGDNYPRVVAAAQQGVQVGFLCPTCRKPREVDQSSGESIWQCKRCEAVMAPCAVCMQRDDPMVVPRPPKPEKEVEEDLEGSGEGSEYESEKQKEEKQKDKKLKDKLKEQEEHKEEDHQKEEESEPVLATWWYCPGCGHGGHSTCMEAWHSGFEEEYSSTVNDFNAVSETASDGYCPFDGCGHACLPGRGQVEVVAARIEEVSRAVKEATKKAVESMKAAVAAAEAEMIARNEHHRRGGDASWGGLEHHPRHHHHHQRESKGHDNAVKSDSQDIVPQSRAVESVRESLASVNLTNTSRYSTPGASILSSSPGRSGMHHHGERERRKSVKWAGQQDLER
ncbi:hypothetical protein QBC38DRAFT_487669 [Podospora fimiseda]|uniref:WD repeat-containing protein n=1 Tax=Podospora fimiseda TaxID=252190 RepID=A0AAN7BHQ4_9PEZI|nr:hypothetical protein QBC38DRAFT_487669 [Podospora fimiseda]